MCPPASPRRAKLHLAPLAEAKREFGSGRAYRGQVVQAMASFGGGSGGLLESFDAVGPGSDPSQSSL